MQPTLANIRDEFAATLSGLDAAQTQCRPARLSPSRPEPWTIQQITEHLILTYRMTTKAMEARLQKGSPTKGRATLVNRVGQYLVTQRGYFPARRTAPEMVQPPQYSSPKSGAELCEALNEALETMDTRIDEVAAAFGPGRTVNHAVLGPMKMSQWRSFHLAHARHHLKQIAAIRQQAQVTA